MIIGKGPRFGPPDRSRREAGALWRAVPVISAVISEIEYFGLGRHVDQMGSAVKCHVGVKAGFIEVPVGGAGSTYPRGHLVFDKIGKVIVDTVTGYGFVAAVPVGHGPVDAVVYQEKVYLMPFGMGDLGELKTSGRFFVVVGPQYK